MSEDKREVRTFAIHYLCDEQECNGEVIRDESKKIIWESSIQVTQVPHMCNKCDKEYIFTERYPKIGHQYMDIPVTKTSKSLSI